MLVYLSGGTQAYTDADFGYALTAIKLVKVAGDTPDGGTRVISAPGPVLYTYTVTNLGETYLADIYITDDNGTPLQTDDFQVCAPTTVLAPGASLQCTRSITVSASRTNIAVAWGYPKDAAGAYLPGAPAQDSDDAIVTLDAGTATPTPTGTPTSTPTSTLTSTDAPRDWHANPDEHADFDASHTATPTRLTRRRRLPPTHRRQRPRRSVRLQRHPRTRPDDDADRNADRHGYAIVDTDDDRRLLADAYQYADTGERLSSDHHRAAANANANADVDADVDADDTDANTPVDATPTSTPAPTRTPTATATPPIPGFIHPKDVAVDPNTHRVYATSRDTDRLYVFDGATLATLDYAGVGREPWGVAVNPATNKVYVANFASGDLYVLDATTLALRTIIPVGPKPTFVKINPITNRVFVVTYGNSSVAVINGYTDTLETTVPSGGTAAWGLAVDPNTNLVYVSNRDSGTVTTLDGNRGYQVVGSRTICALRWPAPAPRPTAWTSTRRTASCTSRVRRPNNVNRAAIYRANATG